ncbi:MAG: hypothetical protein DWQ53_17245 [Microcystis flos-aquae DF17]|nr:MAG: hypothetical protein DWQ53_17245 [Microcystis flos-aquae DF17]
MLLFWSVILYSNQMRSMIQTDQQFPSAIADLVGWVEVTKPNIAFISYLNFLGFTSFNPTYILFHTNY